MDWTILNEIVDFRELRIEPATIHDLGKLARIMIAAYENLSYQYLKKIWVPQAIMLSKGIWIG